MKALLLSIATDPAQPRPGAQAGAVPQPSRPRLLSEGKLHQSLALTKQEETTK